MADHLRCDKCVLTLYFPAEDNHADEDYEMNVHLNGAVFGGRASHMVIHRPEVLTGRHREWFNIVGHRLGPRQTVTLSMEGVDD